METKLCTSCDQVKKVEEFRPNKTKKDGLQHYCSECDKKFQKEWYLKNKERLVEKAKISTKKYKEIARDYIVEYLKSHPCIKCGEPDIVVLEFDHIEAKKYGISDMIIKGYSLNSIISEINKCQVLCCNCHRRKTAKQLGWYDRL